MRYIDNILSMQGYITHYSLHKKHNMTASRKINLRVALVTWPVVSLPRPLYQKNRRSGQRDYSTRAKFHISYASSYVIDTRHYILRTVMSAYLFQ